MKTLCYHFFSLLVIASVFTCCSEPGAPRNQILFHGGTILTVDADFTEVEAMVVQDSHIVATGTYKELLAEYEKTANRIDLKGKTLMPGFIDPHAHVVSFAPIVYTTEVVGLVKFSNTDQVLTHLKQLASERAPGEWIMASNWDPAVQDGVSALTITELDAVSTEHPIFILNTSGHLAYVNSKAFELAGITQEVENPDGAEYVRDADGKLNGVIKNSVAFLPIWQANPDVANVEIEDAITSLLNSFNAYGITTTSEFSLGAATRSTSEFELLKKTAERPDFTARVMAYPFYTLNDAWEEAGVEMMQGNDMVRLTGFKLVADGSNQGYTGLQHEHYFAPSQHDNYGVAYMTVDDMTAIAEQRAAQGWQLAIHGNGDQAIENILEVMERLHQKGYDLKKLRPRIEHCSILHDEQIEKMKELGVSASFLIGHVHYWGTFMRDSVFGPEKAELLDRCASVENAGISFTLQSDFSVTQPNMLKMIEIAVVRNTYKEPDFILAPQERVSVESAIRAVTSEAAWQLNIEDKIGSLEAGKFADMVILSNDPRKVAPTQIAQIKVVETWLNGKKVYPAIQP